MKFFTKAPIFSACLCGLAMLLAGCGDSTVDKLAAYAPSSSEGAICIKFSELAKSPLLNDLGMILDPESQQDLLGDAEIDVMVPISTGNKGYIFVYHSAVADLDQMLAEVDKVLSQAADIPAESVAEIKAMITKSALEDGTEIISCNDEVFILNLAPNVFMLVDDISLEAYRSFSADQLGLSKEQKKRLNDGLADAQIYAYAEHAANSFEFKFNVTPDKMAVNADIVAPSEIANIQASLGMTQMIIGGAVMQYFPDDADLANKLTTAMKVEPQGSDAVKVTFELDRATLEKLATLLKPQLDALQAEMLAASLAAEEEVPAADAAQTASEAPSPEGAIE